MRSRLSRRCRRVGVVLVVFGVLGLACVLYISDVAVAVSLVPYGDRRSKIRWTRGPATAIITAAAELVSFYCIIIRRFNNIIQVEAT